MTMSRDAFESWCKEACSYIRFPPDRPRVARELLEHLEDRFEQAREGGLSEAEAERFALCAMGDAKETGRALCKVHRPCFGFFWKLSQFVLWMSVFIAMMSSCGTRVSEYFTGYGPGIPEPELYSGYVTLADGQYERTSTELKPDCRARCGGYSFRVAKAVYSKNVPLDPAASEEGETVTLYFTLAASHPLPWAGSPVGVNASLYAVDDLDNRYVTYWHFEDWPQSKGELGLIGDSRTLFGYRMGMQVTGLDPQAEWLELRYDRMGREFAMRIDLERGREA